MNFDKDELYIILTWPDCQEYMEEEGWVTNSRLINDSYGLDLYGSSAYFVKLEWFEKVNEKKYEKV